MKGEADNLRGAALMAAAAVIFAVEALAIRWMNGRGIPVEMQVAARSGGQLLWVMPVILGGGVRVFRSARVPMHVLRSLASLTTWALYYFSFTRLDPATATVLSFTNVIFTTLLAAPITSTPPPGRSITAMPTRPAMAPRSRGAASRSLRAA